MTNTTKEMTVVSSDTERTLFREGYTQRERMGYIGSTKTYHSSITEFTLNEFEEKDDIVKPVDALFICSDTERGHTFKVVFAWYGAETLLQERIEIAEFREAINAWLDSIETIAALGTGEAEESAEEELGE